jgi:hypothetical protein
LLRIAEISRNAHHVCEWRLDGEPLGGHIEILQCLVSAAAISCGATAFLPPHRCQQAFHFVGKPAEPYTPTLSGLA